MDTQRLEEFYGQPVIVADREMVESNSDEILRDADKEVRPVTTREGRSF